MGRAGPVRTHRHLQQRPARKIPGHLLAPAPPRFNRRPEPLRQRNRPRNPHRRRQRPFANPMSLGTKILLLMLLITIGTSAALAWIVTFNVTRYETRRADERISIAISRYVSQLEDRHRQIAKIVRALLEAPAPRSQLQAADESQD